jgi:hypothetical protein
LSGEIEIILNPLVVLGMAATSPIVQKHKRHRVFVIIYIKK